MIDHKIPRMARPWVPVVEDVKGEIIWVAGLTRSASAPVTKTTRKYLFLEVIENQLAQEHEDD
jgi:hypothetical protein